MPYFAGLLGCQESSHQRIVGQSPGGWIMKEKEVDLFSTQAFEAVLHVFDDEFGLEALSATYPVEDFFAKLIQGAEKSRQSAIGIASFGADQERVVNLSEQPSEKPFAIPTSVGISRVNQVDASFRGREKTLQRIPSCVAGSQRGETPCAKP